MSNRKRLDRERLEYYLTYLILAYRRLIQITGLCLLGFATALIFINPRASYPVWPPTIFLLLLGNSYNIVVYTARFGAWIGTLWRYDD